MKQLPNGVVVFNATPHTIRFWDAAWEDPVEVEPDEVINARPVERVVETRYAKSAGSPDNLNPFDLERLEAFQFNLVQTRFIGSPEGEATARRALEAGADVVVGSIIAAQAYPGLVMAMVPAPGFERVAPDQKRMRPDKFTVVGVIVHS